MSQGNALNVPSNFTARNGWLSVETMSHLTSRVISSLFCVAVEIFLHSTGYFHWEYWWWNVPFVPLIVIFGYATFFAVAAWVYDMGSNTRKQVRVVGTMAAINLVLGLALGLAGWL